MLLLLQQRFDELLRQHAASPTTDNAVITLRTRGVVPVLHAFRHVCNKLYGVASLPSAGRPAEINEQAFAAVRTNAHAPEGINSGPGQWETLLHTMQRAHNLARMNRAPEMLLRLLSSQYQKLPAYRAEEAAARDVATAAGVDVSDDSLSAEAVRQAVAAHTRSDRMHLNVSDRVLKAFALQARLAALRHALVVAGGMESPAPLREYLFRLAVSASPDAQAVLRHGAAALAAARLTGVSYMRSVELLVEMLGKSSSPELLAAAAKSADDLIPLLLVDLRDCQVRLADLARKEVYDASLSSYKTTADRRHTTLTVVNEARALRDRLVPLLPLSTDPAVRAFVPPAIDVLATSPLPARIGLLVLEAGNAELQAVLAARNQRVSVEEEIDFLHRDVRAAVTNTAALVEQLEVQLDAATAAQPDLAAASGRSGLFLRDGAGTGFGTSIDEKPLLFHTGLPDVAPGDTALFARGLAHEVYRGLQRMRGMLRKWERLQAGLALMPPHRGTALAVQLDARVCSNFTRYGGLLLRGLCLPATWVQHVAGGDADDVGRQPAAVTAAAGGFPRAHRGGVDSDDRDDEHELAEAHASDEEEDTEAADEAHPSRRHSYYDDVGNTHVDESASVGGQSDGLDSDDDGDRVDAHALLALCAPHVTVADARGTEETSV